MSWFDAKGGFASLAKTALKEAVAHIDKALDIQQDGNVEKMQETTVATSSAKKPKLPGMVSREKNDATSQPLGSTSSSTSNWGSFTGSFFENPNANEMVTIPPKSKRKNSMEIHKKSENADPKSDLTEQPSQPSPVLQKPGTESSQIISSDMGSSEDLKMICDEHTMEAVNSESGGSLPGSIVIIGSKDDSCDDEDSISHKTLVDVPSASISQSTELVGSVESDASLKRDLRAASESTVVCPPASSSSDGSNISKILIPLEDAPSESQNADSDSTQSFEDIQMQSSCSRSSTKEAEHATVPDGKLNSIKTTLQSCSPPHSNDEIETATSSDIEIISNPNGGGDSSSTNSNTRASPLKLKKHDGNQATVSSSINQKKGHFREPSEISILSEDSQSELEKLMHRISELNEMLESRELRIVQLERQNAEVVERNNELETTVETLKVNAVSIDSADTYTQRLSALEKKFQASIRERDSLRTQIKDLKDELQNKIHKDVLAESNAMIEELRAEGDKLSKEILQQSNIIKKLRAKEKNCESLLKKNKEEIGSMVDELERLKKTLNAKEEVERSQIEAVHKMSSEKRKLEEENTRYAQNTTDLQFKMTTLQAGFDAMKAELQTRTRLHSDLTRTTEEVELARKEKEMAQAENHQLKQQLADLREKFRSSEQAMAKREQLLREENKELLRRVESAELRAEASTQEASLTTVPLIRQLESLQNTFNQRTNSWNQEEKLLLEKLDVAQSKLKSFNSMEATFREKCDLLQRRCTELEEQLSHTLMEEEKLKICIQQTEMNLNLKESNLNKEILRLSEELTACKNKVDSLEASNRTLEEALNSTVANKSSSTRHASTDDLTQRELSTSTLHEEDQLDERQRAHSPTMSFGRSSLEDAMGGNVDWRTDDIECISNSGRTLGYGIPFNYMGHSASTLEHLQSMLKQREGELAQLQWEQSRLQEDRSILTEEISNLTVELENIKDKLQSYEIMEKEFNELQQRYDALLQMYGEKVERTEELELDLIELKEAYKTQINELLAKPRSTT